jgi:TolA-binding protein
MKYSAIISAFIVAVPLYLNASEPSAFGAGDLSSPEPYGLTPNEEVILKTKKELKKIEHKSRSQESQLDSLRERLDGLQSIVESLSRKAHNNKVNLDKLKEEERQSFANASEYEQRLAASIEENAKKLQEIQAALLETTKHIDTIDSNYVSKDEYNRLVKNFNDFKSLVAKELKSGGHTKSSKKSKISSPELYNLAKKNFDRKYYTKAIENYEELIKRNYKPAFAHYMIGEMYFKRKNYALALTYFKKSSKLYSKASYMPKLLLHSAIAMDKTGDKAHAKKFYQAVIAKYPNSKEAKEAKRFLAKL